LVHAAHPDVDPFRTIRTGRLLMTPVAWADLPDLTALKSDPQVYALMLGGVRTKVQVMAELAEDLVFWGRTGIGMWSVRDRVTDAFLGTTGLMDRPDGRGIALRFAFWVHVRHHGLAREAAGAALRFGHLRVPTIIAVARETNLSSRLVLGGIGMKIASRFERDGEAMVIYESRRAS
jgi:RimJ/RimL family protein N-acetyltransferase